MSWGQFRKLKEANLYNKKIIWMEDDELDASIQASSPAGSTGIASPNTTLQSEVAVAETVHNLDVNQKLDLIRNDIATKIDGNLKAIQDVQRNVRDFSGRMDKAEKHIGEVEDTVNSEKGKTEALVKQVALLTNKLDELENHSRRSNLRLVNLPEKVENNDAVAFLERWLPEALGPAAFPTPPVIERAQRLPSRTQSRSNLLTRVLIIKFLNFQDKVWATRAARAKGKVLCGGQEVMFFPDLSAELHRQRRRFDGVKQQLRSLNIRYGIMNPAKLRLTINGQTHEFDSPADAEKFVQGIQLPEDAQRS